jgi:hypothetical protein
MGGGLIMAARPYTDVFSPKEQSITQMVMVVLFSIATIGIGWLLGWPLIFDINDPDFNPIIIVMGLCLGVVIYSGFKALRWRALANRIGTTELQVDGPTPASLGAPFAGRLRTGNRITPTGAFRIRLICYDIHERGTSGEDSSRTEWFEVWQHDLTLPPESDSAAGLSFRFQLPASVGQKPVSRMERPKSYVSFKASIHIPGFRKIVTHNSPPIGRSWKLIVTAPTKGPDFRAEFVAPIKEY